MEWDIIEVISVKMPHVISTLMFTTFLLIPVLFPNSSLDS
ncbi:hypothetical protein BTN50_0169 [Candidatus Enterovibrio altilux]|uniref:Uncharacterized protein n=1 Tax=Candidatus Enterovibrio altilux TaxID=1927128 RepID=A0A291B6T8_9GAMM|nr:hypothetical protein BTN50_0169 [Candidatus Enterovibrio luxaltus]